MKISPSLLSADFGNLERDVIMLNESVADYLHLDVMDGVFVPNISFGFPIIKSIQKVATKPLDVHLMIVNPQNYISQVRDCGAEIMNIHQEACVHLHRTIQAIKNAGMKAAVTINPSTPVSSLEDIITDVDMGLIMSVKVKQLKELIQQSGSNALIEVDGGVNLDSGKLLANAGADILVAGNAVFSANNPKDMILKLHNL